MKVHKKRKIVQILLMEARPELNPQNDRHCLFAVCDDGTLWWKNMGGGAEFTGSWQMEESIPDFKPTMTVREYVCQGCWKAYPADVMLSNLYCSDDCLNKVKKSIEAKPRRGKKVRPVETNRRVN